MVQVIGSRSSEAYQVRVALDDNYDRIVFIEILNKPILNILDNDQLSFRVRIAGEYSYEAVLGNPITLPLAFATDVIFPESITGNFADVLGEPVKTETQIISPVMNPEAEEPAFVIPLAISRERYEYFTKKMTKSTRKKVNAYYSLIQLENVENETERETLIEQNPRLAEGPLYILKSDTTEEYKAKLNGYFAEIGYTIGDYEYDACCWR